MSLLKHLPSTAVDTWSDAADLLVSGPIEAPTDGGIALIPLGKIPSEQLKYLSDELKRALKGRGRNIGTDLRKTGSCATQILVTTPGAMLVHNSMNFAKNWLFNVHHFLAGC